MIAEELERRLNNVPITEKYLPSMVYVLGLILIQIVRELESLKSLIEERP